MPVTTLHDSFSKCWQLAQTNLCIASFFGQNWVLSPHQLLCDARSVQQQQLAVFLGVTLYTYVISVELPWCKRTPFCHLSYAQAFRYHKVSHHLFDWSWMVIFQVHINKQLCGFENCHRLENIMSTFVKITYFSSVSYSTIRACSNLFAAFLTAFYPQKVHTRPKGSKWEPQERSWVIFVILLILFWRTVISPHCALLVQLLETEESLYFPGSVNHVKLKCLQHPECTKWHLRQHPSDINMWVQEDFYWRHYDRLAADFLYNCRYPKTVLILLHLFCL